MSPRSHESVPLPPARGARRWPVPVLLCLLLFGFARGAAASDRFAALLAGLDDIRTRLAIPGMSVAVAYGDGSVEAAGLGMADIENGIPAEPETQYNIASVTKGFSAIIALQLVREGRLRLDFPMSLIDAAMFNDPGISVGHVLSHTATGHGKRFAYNTDQFMRLTPLLERAGRKSFPELVHERILLPGQLGATCPGRDFPATRHGLKNLARPYRIASGRPQAAELPTPECNAAYGIVSTVLDLARYSQLLETDLLLGEADRKTLFSPTVSPGGWQIPYALGWFVEDFRGTRIEWHYGWRVGCYASLIVRLPARKLTFVVLANCDRLVSSSLFAYGSLFRSPFALEFLRRYELAEVHGRDLPAISPDWDDSELDARLAAFGDGEYHLYAQELLARAQVESVIGNVRNALRLMRVAVTRYPASGVLDDYGTLVTMSYQDGAVFARAFDEAARRLLIRDPDDPWVNFEMLLAAVRRKMPFSVIEARAARAAATSAGFPFQSGWALYYATRGEIPLGDPARCWFFLRQSLPDERHYARKAREGLAALRARLEPFAFWLDPLADALRGGTPAASEK